MRFLVLILVFAFGCGLFTRPVPIKEPLLQESFAEKYDPEEAVVKVTKKHWETCCRICGHGKRVRYAGVDTESGEEICTCTDRIMYRMEPLE